MIRHYCRFKLLITIDDDDDYWDAARLFTHSDFAILFFLKLLPVITIIIFTFTFDDNAAADILGVFNTSSV